MNSGLPKPLTLYIGLVSFAGAAWLSFLVTRIDWGTEAIGETVLFGLLVMLAGSFPFPVAPKVKTDVTTAVLFASALLLDPVAAALAGTVGIVTYTYLLRFRRDRLRLPWYKYPFNAGATALYVGVTSVVFRGVGTSDDLLALAVLPAAAVMYVTNTALVSCVVSLQMKVSPLRFWWNGTRENGLAELSLLAFGFLGAVAYEQSPWTVLALVIPVAIIDLAFSRLARANAQLKEANRKLEALQGHIANSAKLASVGAISLDMAHQIKNPLTILLGRLETLSDRLERGNPHRRHLEIAIGAGWRIQEITQNFTYMSQQKPVEIDVKSLLTEAYGMAGLRSHTRVKTTWEYQENLPKIPGNPVLLREALSNIFSNALEAVRDEGLITTRASRVDGSVIVRISDNGPGIPAQIKEHLFEPFQSTKPRGTGLGLFATKHIIEMHRGGVEVETMEGKGTSITVILPVHSQGSEDTQGADNGILSPTP